MKNVIQMGDRLNKAQKDKKPRKSNSGNALVIDMTEKRNTILTRERRRARRTILSEFVGAFVLVPEKGLLKVSLFDISEEGLSFDIEKTAGHFHVGEQLALRVYLNQETYFPLVVEIHHIRAVPDEETFRHGVTFVSGAFNQEALHHFVKFIETVSSSLQSDDGDRIIPNFAR